MNELRKLRKLLKDELIGLKTLSEQEEEQVKTWHLLLKLARLPGGLAYFKEAWKALKA